LSCINCPSVENLYISSPSPKARHMGIKVLRFIGDYDLVVMQVKDQFATKNDRLGRYRNAMWDKIELFDALSIKIVPRTE